MELNQTESLKFGFKEKRVASTMYSRTILNICIFLCVSYNSFALNQLSLDESVILNKIITNFIAKYLDHQKIFVAFICASSGDESNLEDLFFNLFDDSSLTEFTYSVSDKLRNDLYRQRIAFNIILTKNSMSLS